jgi:hypothetical protein
MLCEELLKRGGVGRGGIGDRGFEMVKAEKEARDHGLNPRTP